MATKKARDVKGALARKGFTEAAGGRDHTYFFLWYKQKKTPVYTKVSHGERDIGPPLLSGMAKQLRITKGEFENLIDCSLDGEGYIRLLIERKIIATAPDPIPE